MSVAVSLPFVGTLTELAPERVSAAVRQLTKLVLAPAKQRRDQQACQAEIVARLNREADRGKEILHCNRLVKM